MGASAGLGPPRLGRYGACGINVSSKRNVLITSSVNVKPMLTVKLLMKEMMNWCVWVSLLSDHVCVYV